MGHTPYHICYHVLTITYFCKAHTSWISITNNLPWYPLHAQNGLSPLMLASWKGHTHVVDLLIKNGAHTDLRDEVSCCRIDTLCWCLGYIAEIDLTCFLCHLDDINT